MNPLSRLSIAVPAVLGVRAALLGAVTLAALTTGCGVAADDVAATVGDTDISTALVADFAESTYVAQVAEQSGQGLVSPTEGTTGGAKQRLALSLLVQGAVYREAVQETGESISDDDRAQAEEIVAQVEQGAGAFTSRTRKAVLDLATAQNALIRILGSESAGAEVTDEEIQAYFDANADQFGLLSCVDGFAVAVDRAAAAQAAVDAGTDIATILADPELSPQPLSQDGSETCIPLGQITEPTLAELVDEGPIGQWSTANISDPQAGDLAVFIRPNSREEATAETPSVAEQIRTTLQQEADAAVQAELQETFAGIVNDAEVTIDPRYGRWDPSQQDPLVAPLAPRLSADAQPVPLGDDPLAGDPQGG